VTGQAALATPAFYPASSFVPRKSSGSGPISPELCPAWSVSVSASNGSHSGSQRLTGASFASFASTRCFRRILIHPCHLSGIEQIQRFLNGPNGVEQTAAYVHQELRQILCHGLQLVNVRVREGSECSIGFFVNCKLSHILRLSAFFDRPCRLSDNTLCSY
jgi:hypothetical protein